MKANQNFRSEEEAVSPVIGVILMVAITVVLAAVVFVLVSDLGSTDAQAPSVNMFQDGDKITVVDADPEATWDDIKFTHDCDTATLTASGVAETVGAQAASPASVLAVTAGDKVVVTDAAGSCSLTLIHGPTNQLYQTWDFTV